MPCRLSDYCAATKAPGVYLPSSRGLTSSSFKSRSSSTLSRKNIMAVEIQLAHTCPGLPVASAAVVSAALTRGNVAGRPLKLLQRLQRIIFQFRPRRLDEQLRHGVGQLARQWRRVRLIDDFAGHLCCALKPSNCCNPVRFTGG